PEPTVKGLPFARALARAGHEVQVITGFPNYPGGKLYPGYRIRLRQREVVDGVSITRVPLYPSHSDSVAGRVLNYASFAASVTVAALFSRFRPDVVYVYHPPLTVGLAASLVSLVRRAPFVYDVQDLWPDTLAATGMISSRRILRMIGWLADWVYRRAALVLAQSPGFVDRLIERGVPAEKVRLVYNWCDEDALARREAAPPAALAALNGRFNVVFAGNMGKAQALESVIEAASIVAARSDRVQFVFVGGGTEVDNLQEYARKVASNNVVFLPRMSMAEVGHLLDAADVLLVHLRDEVLFAITLPSKTQAYLFAGRPIVMAVPGDAATLIGDAQAGVCAQPEDPHSIAEAVLSLESMPEAERIAMGARGRSYYQEALSLAVGTRRMLDAFESVIALRDDAKGATMREARA
ncbi:MAG TPA: glycosyltransferase family 4 protein, partial [Polyangia bacterium]